MKIPVARSALPWIASLIFLGCARAEPPRPGGQDNGGDRGATARTAAPPPDAGVAPGADPSLAGDPTWEERKDPRGFRLRHPPGWRVEVTEGRGVVVRGPDGAFALAAPVLAAADATAEDVLRDLRFRDAALLDQARITAVRQIGERPDQATATLRFAAAQGEAQASLLCSLVRGAGTGMIFAVAAPAARFAQERPQLVEILRSFSYIEPAATSESGSAGTALSYVRWQDPMEGAYSVEVPKGWQVEGGTTRRSPVEPRHFLRATSPEGVMVGFGDPSIPAFCVPNDMLTWSGFQEGSWYSPTGVATFMVMSFQPGLQYAEGYAGHALGQGLADIQLRERRDRADLVAQANQAYAQNDHTGIVTRATSGEVSFTASHQGKPLVGYCLVTTEIVQGAGMAQWSVQGPAYYIAPAGMAHDAAAALARMFQTIAMSPQWVRTQQGTTAAVADITARSGELISRAISDSYWARQQSQDRAARNFSDAIRDVQRVVNPETGQELEAVAGSNYYYVTRGGEQPFGSDSPDVGQAINVTPLLRVP